MVQRWRGCVKSLAHQRSQKTTPPAAADPRTWANTFNTPGQSRNTPGLRISQIGPKSQTELLVQYVKGVKAYKCENSGANVKGGPKTWQN